MKSWSAYDIGTPLYDRGFHKVIEPVITEYKHYLHVSSVQYGRHSGLVEKCALR